MKTLTTKQREFVSNKAAGLTHRDAAIAAGYSSSAAEATATKLMRNPAIRNAVKAAEKTLGVAIPGADKNTMQRAKYDDPKTFLEDVMNHPHLPIAMRTDAAKQLLPYVHARMGETGKKETAKKRAGEIASGRHKFAMKLPPQLRVVTNNPD